MQAGASESPLPWAEIRRSDSRGSDCARSRRLRAAENVLLLSLSAEFNDAVCEKLSTLYLSMGRFDDWGRLQIRRLEEDSSLSENAVLEGAMDTMEHKGAPLYAKMEFVLLVTRELGPFGWVLDRLESLSKQLGMGKQAAQALESILPKLIGDDRADVHRVLGDLYLTELRDFEKAKSHFQELVVIQPGMNTHLKKLVDALVRNGETPVAIAILEGRLKGEGASQELAELWTLLAQLFEALAKVVMRNGLGHNPSHWQTFRWM